MSRIIARRAAVSGSSTGSGSLTVGMIVREALSHHCPASSRVESSTSAPGLASTSSLQKALAGQSTVAP